MKSEFQDKKEIIPQKLARDSKFKFKCHPEIACFTKCCSDINLILTPYDILRMKKRLNISSEEFLAKYTRPQTLEKIGLPVVTLKMMDDDSKSCPFVTPKGCTIYPDRPATCRYYPIGFATLKEENITTKDEFFFFVKEDHCLGFEEDQEWTVQSWREDQEPELYDRMNRDWTEVLIKKQSLGAVETSEKSLQLFFMVSYDIDRFRRFVFESPFLKKYQTPSDLVEEIREDDEALMLFGLHWLKTTLFGLAPPKPAASKKSL
jgi:Fe-S-cluster containining protein